MIKHRIKDVKILSEYKKLAGKIVEEHFNITLPFDRSYNYLWYMYHKGQKQGELADFIILSEINLLLKTGEIDQEGFDNLIEMLKSTDDGNIYMAIVSVKTLRKERIKKHGEFKDIETASPLMVDIATDLYNSSTIKMDLEKIKRS